MLKRTLYLLLFPILLSACSDINCPLNSTVFSSYTMKGDTLKDTLSIIAIRPDSSDAVLLNRFVGKTTFKIQMSYVKDVDSLLFLYSDTAGNSQLDTVVVRKINIPHFESVDCPANYFHTIIGTNYTRHRIDSIVINNPNVDYDANKKHFFIYFNSGN